MAAALDSAQVHGPRPLYRADDVARLLRMARPTIYEISRETPDLLGAVRLGRSVRFRPDVVDALVRGDA